MNILYINHYAGSMKHGMEFRPYYLSREWIKKVTKFNLSKITCDKKGLNDERIGINNNAILQHGKIYIPVD